MGRVDIASNIGYFDLIPFADRSAAVTIVGADVSEFHGAAFVIEAGTYTSGTGYTVTLQHRDGSDAWADIPDDQLYGDATANDIAIVEADEDTKQYIGYSGNKEQIGALLTRDGTGVMEVGVVVIAGHPTVIPPVSR